MDFAQTHSGLSSGGGESENGEDGGIPQFVYFIISGGVVLILAIATLVSITVCCVWSYKRRGSWKLSSRNNTGVSSKTHTTNSSRAHQMSVSDMSYASAQRLLSKESRGGRDGTEPSSVDHTVTETLDMDSNPLYHLDPLTLPPRIRQQHEWPTITESAFSSNFSQSPRGRSLSYIQMQSAGHVFGAIVSSRSVDFTDSVIYDELDVHFVTRLPEAGSSFTPPTNITSGFTRSLPTNHCIKRPVTPPPSLVSPLPPSHPPKVEVDGPEDEYVDPQLFREDEEIRKSRERVDQPEACYEEVPDTVRTHLTKNNESDFGCREDFLPLHRKMSAPALLPRQLTITYEPPYDEVATNRASYFSDGYEPMEELQKLQKDRSVLTEREEEDSEGGVHTNRAWSLDDQYVEVVGQSRVSHTLGRDPPSPHTSKPRPPPSEHPAPPRTATMPLIQLRSPHDQMQHHQPNLAPGPDIPPPHPSFTPSPSLSSSSSPSDTNAGKMQNSAGAKPRLLPKPPHLAMVTTSNGKPRSSMERATIGPQNEFRGVGDRSGSPNQPHLEELEFPPTVSMGDGRGGKERDMTVREHTYDECRVQRGREVREEGSKKKEKKEEEEGEEEEYVSLYYNLAQDVELYQNVANGTAR